jgi:hypothetical protein
MQGGYPGLLMNMLFATQNRATNEMWAAGPFVQNLDHKYTLTTEEMAYLAGMGVNAADLLAKMNARTDVAGNVNSRNFVRTYGDLRGFLKRPALTLHTTLDGLAEVANESAYRQKVELWGLQDNLIQAYVKGVGHCAFTSQQLLSGLAAVENWLDTGVRPGKEAFPEALGFDNAFVPPPWPY